MTLQFWVKIIPARWCRVAATAVLCATAVATALSAQSFEALADRYRKTPNAYTRAAVLRYAQTHHSDKNGALALLLLGATENDAHQFGDALAHLKLAAKRLPELSDYVAYLSAVADSGLRQFNDTEPALQPLWHATPASPLVTKAVLLQAESYLQGGNPANAVTLVQQHLADLSTPQAELLLARAYEAQNDGAQAAQHYQKIYIEYPLSKEASDAEAALTRYPNIPPEALFARGLKLEAGGDYTRAGKELTDLLPRLSGENFDLARVRIGAAAYLGRDNDAAYKYLHVIPGRRARRGSGAAVLSAGMPAPVEPSGRDGRHARKVGPSLSAIPLAAGSAGGGGQLRRGARSARRRPVPVSNLL